MSNGPRLMSPRNAVLSLRANDRARVRSNVSAVRSALMRAAAAPFKHTAWAACLCAKQISDTRTAAPSTNQGSSGQNVENDRVIQDSFQHQPTRTARIELVATRPARSVFTFGNQPSGLGEPIANQVRFTVHQSAVCLAHCLGVIMSQLTVGAFCFPKTAGCPPPRLRPATPVPPPAGGQHRVAALDGIQRLQDRIARASEAVAAHPLNLTDPTPRRGPIPRHTG